MHGNEIAMNDAAILRRIVEPQKPTFSVAASRAILALDFSADDKDRMLELSSKARQGSLSTEEKKATDSYERVGHLLNILQSKARRSLKQRRASNGRDH